MPSATGDSFLAVVGDLFESLPVAIVVADAGRAIRLLNREAEQLLGYRRDELIGQPVEILVPEELRAAHAIRHAGFTREPAARRMGAGRDLMARRADGSLVPVEIALKPLQTVAGPMVVAAILDISARKALERQSSEATAALERRVRERTMELEQSNREKQDMLDRLEQARADLERLSRQDPLTGLANRREFAERVAIEQERARRHDSPLCLAMLDIDHFKRVNDCHGHAFGDEVLREFGRILQHQCRAMDIVSRHGGEEFALALPDTSLADATTICERIRLAIKDHPWHHLKPDLRMTISIGVAKRRSDESVESALARADALLYQAKARGRDRVEGGLPLPAA